MAMQLRKAERKKAKLRIGFSGPSGSGKTMSALELAYGMTGDWSKIVLIDSENGSGELYSSIGDYNIITLDAPYTPERYIEAIKACEDAGMDVIIIDSTSHEWDGRGGCLEINERLAGSKFKGNTWAAWSETTPRHQKFIEAIVTSKCHILTTARSKTDTIQTEDKKIKKVGTKEIQREGFEYELTVNFNIDRDHHLAIASKDRTGLFIDRDPFLITHEIGKELIEWNKSGVDGEALEAERIAREEKEKAEREEQEEKAKENLYNSLIADMEEVKFIDDLAAIWNTQVQPNKEILGDVYIKDLTERKDAIKTELQKTPEDKKNATPVTPTPAEKKSPVKEAPKTPAPEVKKEEVTLPPVVEKIETPAEPTKENPEVAPVDASKAKETEGGPAKDTVTVFNNFIDQIKATKSVDELNEVILEIDTALARNQIELRQHGVLMSHKGIQLNKIPK